MWFNGQRALWNKKWRDPIAVFVRVEAEVDNGKMSPPGTSEYILKEFTYSACLWVAERNWFSHNPWYFWNHFLKHFGKACLTYQARQHGQRVTRPSAPRDEHVLSSPVHRRTGSLLSRYISFLWLLSALMSPTHMLRQTQTPWRPAGGIQMF